MKNYILTLFETKNDRVSSIHLTRTRTVVTLIAIMVTFFSTAYFLSRLIDYTKTNHRFHNIQIEKAILQKRFSDWETRTLKIEGILDNLQKKNREILVAADLPVPKIPYGVGGPVSNSRIGFPEIPKLKETELNLSKLEANVDRLRRNMVELGRSIASRMKQIAHYPSIRPVRSGWISSFFGERIDPFTGQTEDHLAIDISVKPGTEVYASGAGVVKAVNRKVIKNKGYGKYIHIDHGYDYETLYAHLSKIFVKKGQEVKRWDLIGLSGNTGKSTAPHLHYGVFANREAKNPDNFILE